MKYCPYCGASLVGGAASFCAECGKKIPAQTDPPTGPAHPAKRKRNPMDINYDGYYDDVKPVDAGEQEEGVDPEMIKKVAILLAGVFAVILASVALMMLL